MALHKNWVRASLLSTVVMAAGALNVAAAADFSAVPAGKYQNDTTHSYITFSYSHLGLSNPTLSFDDFSVDLDLNTDDPTQSSVTVTIDTNSLLTGSPILKDHLSGGDWFDVKNNPTITFQSTGIEATGENTFTVTGDLTVKGETKPLSLNVTLNAAMAHPMSKKPVVGFGATGNLLRSEFGLGKFAPFVGDDLTLSFTAEMGPAS